MKRSRLSSAFTLIEMLMVMLIIGIIASLIVSVAGYANKKSTEAKTKGEIAALGTACENYRTDNASYPRLEGTTEQTGDGTSPIDARNDGNPLSTKYKNSSLYLYQQLAGDDNKDGRGGDNGAKVYYEFKPNVLGGMTNGGTTGTVAYLQDPYGFSYGYSTSGARAEDEFRATASTDATGSAKRSSVPHGFNTTFDLWSTAGVTVDPPTNDSRKRWVKNW